MSACQNYEAQPLEPEGFLGLVEASRVAALPVSMDGVLTFERAADILRAQGPEIRAVEAAYRTALARADIPTPLANPTLEVGARFGFGSEMDDASVNRVAPFGAIGITIPTANKRSLQDEVNRLRAESLRICAVARHRELYLQLRRLHALLQSAQAEEEALRGVSVVWASVIGSARRLAETGVASTQSAAGLAVEAADDEVKQAALGSDISQLKAEMAGILGITKGGWSVAEGTLPRTLDEVSIDSLKTRLMLEHPELARMRAEYELAERILQLEVARQYPDIVIGPSGEMQPDARKTFLGLSLGIEIPLFDRNEQEIAEAKARRDEIRIRFEGTSAGLLTRLEATLDAWAWACRQVEALRSVQVKAKALEAVTQRQGSLGTLADPLSLHRARIAMARAGANVEAARRIELAAWMDIEAAIGAPLSPEPELPPFSNESLETKDAE